ncbi:MAG: queuosine precursor transporter [Phycisphaerales bacterium]|nr:queuosine precursor transporter [Phycisphaerales bacterium]
MALHPIEASAIHARRERVFLVIAGIFLGTLAMLNILGLLRFINFTSVETESWGTLYFGVMIGVLPYPVTFLCTDLICEIYGRSRANMVVFVGLLLNLWIIFILWIGGVLPGTETIDPLTSLPKTDEAGQLPVFFQVRAFAFGAVWASMIAYLLAQLVDVWMFHFWKKLTKGRHLWLRNNGSTLVSQSVDTVVVILVTYWLGGFASMITDDTDIVRFLVLLMVTGYVFKLACALFDTIPFYLLVRWLSRYLQIDPNAELNAEESNGKRHE